MNNSIWTEAYKECVPKFEAQAGDRKIDVLIIGGGIAGILCAYKLKEAGVDCLLIEKDRILGKTTKDTTAKITAQHGLIYDKITKRYGIETAKLYYEAQSKAMKEYERLSKKIDCDYEKRDSFVYSLTNRKKIEKELNALERIGAHAGFCDSVSLPFMIEGAVRLYHQAQLNPLKLLYELSRDLPILENTKALELKKNSVKCSGGEIHFEKLIIATHFPILNKHGGYFLKMYQHRSYVLALQGAQQLDGMYVDEKDSGMSFRMYKDTLLLGGGGHKTGKGGGCWQELEDFCAKYYSRAKIVGKWATQDCITLDGIPYIGQYSMNTPNVFALTGFNKWGMTSSMVGAELLCDLVRDKKNDYASVFSPTRSIVHPRLISNATGAIVNLLTPTAPRCPHLGCALKYNRTEHSWDCPCHGSRFDEGGAVLDGPATDDKKFK